MKYVQSIILTTTNFGAGSPNIHNHYLLFTAAKKCLLFLRPNRILQISHDPQLKLHFLHFFKCKNAVLTSPVEIDNNHIAIWGKNWRQSSKLALFERISLLGKACVLCWKVWIGWEKLQEWFQFSGAHAFIQDLASYEIAVAQERCSAPMSIERIPETVNRSAY